MAIFLSLFFLPTKGTLEGSRILYETWISLNILPLFSNNNNKKSSQSSEGWVPLNSKSSGRHAAVFSLGSAKGTNLLGQVLGHKQLGMGSLPWHWAGKRSLVWFHPFGSLLHIFGLLPVARSDVFSLRPWGERSPLCIQMQCSEQQNAQALLEYFSANRIKVYNLFIKVSFKGGDGQNRF